MDNYLKYVDILLFVILSLTVAGKPIQAAEDKKDSLSHPPHIIFEAKLPSDRYQNYTDKADSLVFQFKGNGIKANLRLLQTPKYDIDLSKEPVTADHLRDLIPVAGQLVRLKLDQSGIDSICLPIIAQLTGLTDLDLSANQIDNMNLASLTSLVNLRKLRLDYNMLTSMVGEVLFHLKHLVALSLNRNLLGNPGIQNLSCLSTLKNLEVRSCGFDHTSLPNFLLLPHLETLDISHNDYMETNTVEAFQKQAQERGIKVTSEQWKTVTHIKEPSREYYKLKIDAPIVESELVRLRDRVYLDIQLSTYVVNGYTGYQCADLVIGPETINPDIEFLALSSCQLAPERTQGLKLFTNLRKLSLSANWDGDDFVPIITQITGLQDLSLCYCDLSNKCIPSLLAMPKLLELDLRGNKEITNDVSELFLNNKTLQMLNIGCTGMDIRTQIKIRDKYKDLRQQSSITLDEKY